MKRHDVAAVAELVRKDWSADSATTRQSVPSQAYSRAADNLLALTVPLEEVIRSGPTQSDVLHRSGFPGAGAPLCAWVESHLLSHAMATVRIGVPPDDAPKRRDRKRHGGPPMTLGNMRENGVGSLAVYCESAGVTTRRLSTSSIFRTASKFLHLVHGWSAMYASTLAWTRAPTTSPPRPSGGTAAWRQSLGSSAGATAAPHGGTADRPSSGSGVPTPARLPWRGDVRFRLFRREHPGHEEVQSR